MGRWGLALSTFFRVLKDSEFAERLEESEGEPALAPARSEALTLLATLQREGRLVDFLMEPLDGYSDAQIGAATRDVHRDCGEAVRRLFAPEPVRSEVEGSAVEIPDGFDPESIRLTGNVSGTAPHRGTLRHPGWQAGRCELPRWSGNEASAAVVAPAEVEL